MMKQHHVRYPCALTRLVLLLLVCFTSCAALEEHHTTSSPLHRRITEREIHVAVPLESEKVLVNGEEKRYIPVGLEPLSSYELRVSYVSSHSVQIRFGYACGSISGMEGYQQRRRYGRKLLNAEKIVFKTDANSAVIPSPLEKEIKQGLGDGDLSCRGEKRAVMLTLEVFPWGMMGHNENSIGLFEYDVVLEKNYLGIPVSSVPVLSMALGSVGMLLVFGVGWWMRVVVKDYLGNIHCQSCSTRNGMTCQVKHERVYVHVDCDCFYAQCEELRDPKLSKVPLGITQKYLIVTCNYHARGRGVTKLMSIDDAVKKCPELVLVDGSDLTPYKAISDQIVDLLHVYGNVKRLGCDEMFVDVTDQVIQRTARHDMDPGEYVGHMWLPGSSIQQESIHRVMDLRAKGDEHKGTIPDELMDKSTTRKLIVGSQVARDMRRVVMSASNIRMSAGIATSQIMAKLISGLHKPNDQTILLPEFAKDFLKDLPVRVILGVGRVLSQKLAAHGIVNVSDLWSWSKERIVQEFGERQGMFLYMASQGMDQEGALIHGSSMEPKTISLEDSLRLCSGFEDSKRLLLKLAPDLVHRIDAHFQKYGKVPTILTVTYRMKEAGMHERHACSTKIPKHIHTTSLVDSAMSVLKTKLHEPFHLSLLNIAAKNFHHASSIDLDTSHDGPIKSKREIRMTREAGGLRPPPSSHEGDDESFWRDLNDVGLNSNAIQHTSTRVLNKRPSSSSQRPLQGQRKKITSFFQKK